MLFTQFSATNFSFGLNFTFEIFRKVNIQASSQALHMVSFEIIVKSMPPSLTESKVTPSFCFPFKIPDDPTPITMQCHSNLRWIFCKTLQPSWNILTLSPIFRMTTHCALSFSLRPEAKTGSTTRLKVNKRNATNISAKMAVFFLPLYFRKSASSSMAHNCRRSSGILVFSLKPFPPRKKTNINISSVVEFQRWWVLKSKIFAMW